MPKRPATVRTPSVSTDQPIRKSGPAGSVQLELPQLEAANLAGERLRQVGDELDAARVCLRGEVVADERRDLAAG